LCETRDCIPESDLHTEGAFLCGDGCELVLGDVPSCGETENSGVAESEKVAGVLGEERVTGGFGEACLGVFECTVAVEPEAVCAAGESSRGGVAVMLSGVMSKAFQKPARARRSAVLMSQAGSRPSSVA